MSRAAAVVLAFVGGMAVVSAQSARPALDVVSIREDRLVAQFIPKQVQFQPGRLRIDHLTIEDLVAHAYAISPPRVRDRRIVGWPNAAIKDTRFNVTATLVNAAGRISAEDQRRLILDLLTSRFSFKAHTEQRPVDAYRLMLVTPGGMGRGLRRVDFNCAEMSRDDAPRDENGRSMCGFGETRFDGGAPRLVRRGSGAVSRLIRELNTIAPERVIVDATGLQGLFVWDYEYGRLAGTIHTVLREQLGLTLEPARLPLDVIVIDEVRLPTPN